MLTERSVRFDAHEVLATLAGSKTQMRRVMRVYGLIGDSEK